MKLSSLISPGTWELVDRLRPYLDVCIDLFDGDLEPLLPESNEPLAKLIRRLPRDHAEDADIADGRSGNRFRIALQTATTQLFTVENCRIGLFPLRHARRVVGVLATAEAVSTVRAPSAATPSDVETPLLPFGGLPPLHARPPGGGIDGPPGERLERLGWSLRASIESDIETHARLTGEQQQTRWLATTLRFLEHLHACADEATLTESLVQAAAIWGDLDARVYRRTLDGTFVLHAALPSLQDRIGPRTISGAALGMTGGSIRLSSVAELEQLGWSGPHADVSFVPLGDDGAEWLLAIGGAIDERFQRVLTVAAHTLTLKLDQLSLRRTASLVQVMTQVLGATADAGGRRFEAALSEVARALRAIGASLEAADADGQPGRVLASVGSRSTALRSLASSATHLACPVPTTGSRRIELHVDTTPGQPFGASASLLAAHAAAILGPWLATEPAPAR